MPRSSAIISRMLGLKAFDAFTSQVVSSEHTASRTGKQFLERETWPGVNVCRLEGEVVVWKPLAGKVRAFPLN